MRVFKRSVDVSLAKPFSHSRPSAPRCTCISVVPACHYLRQCPSEPVESDGWRGNLPDGAGKQRPRRFKGEASDLDAVTGSQVAVELEGAALSLHLHNATPVEGD